MDEYVVDNWSTYPLVFCYSLHFVTVYRLLVVLKADIQLLQGHDVKGVRGSKLSTGLFDYTKSKILEDPH